MLVSPASARRRGFTLTEMLAVLSIVALLLIVLAPAIHVARDRARSLKCRNNLKEIGIAMLNYHDTYGCFAPGYVAATKPGKEGVIDLAWNLGNGWQVGLLPYMDQAPLYVKIDFTSGMSGLKEIGKTKLAVFRCAEDKGSDIVAKVTLQGPFPDKSKTSVQANMFARSNYVGVAGWDNDWHLGMTAPENPNGPADGTASNWSTLELGSDFRDGVCVYAGAIKLDGKGPSPNARDYHGFFGENSSRRMDDLTDGRSFTLTIGERSTPTKSDAETDVGNAIWGGVADRSTRVGQSLSLGSAYWPINHGVKDGTIPNTTGFNSRHDGGGAHFVVGDGSVRTISQKIELSAFRRLCVVGDGVRGKLNVPALP
jgi:prepilin-type N-terminal cleavage/methylation domain-containing protein